MITAARIVFAYSRDGALPGSRWWSQVDRRLQTPVLATWCVTGVSILVGLLMFAGTVTIDAVFTLGESTPVIKEHSITKLTMLQLPLDSTHLSPPQLL